jgi:hypothetical protein
MGLRLAGSKTVEGGDGGGLLLPGEIGSPNVLFELRFEGFVGAKLSDVNTRNIAVLERLVITVDNCSKSLESCNSPETTFSCDERCLAIDEPHDKGLHKTELLD